MLNDVQVAEIRLRYANGQSARQLAGRFGVSPSTIERAIPPDERRPGRYVPRVLPISDAELIRLRDVDGLPWAELGARTGLSLWGARNRYYSACRRRDASAEV